MFNMSTNSDVIVEVNDLHKSFKLPHEQHTGVKQLILNVAKTNQGYEVQDVLHGLNFEIKRGEFFGIVGRNGSGKSTLLKLLAGIYVPDSGYVKVNGTLTPFIELGVGFNPELTGRENVFLNGALLGFDRGEMKQMYGDIVKFAELEKFMDQKLKNYSSGMQVRLAFSIAIRANSDILLIDEVLAVGDAAFQQKCFNYFESLKRNKKTVILVTHDMSAVKRFCDRAIYIKEGKILNEGSPYDIAGTYQEENIDNGNATDKSLPKLTNNFHLTHNVVAHDDDSTNLEFKYRSNEEKEMYIGISVIKDGITLAELTTPHEDPVIGSGSLTYNLDNMMFNEGIYRITAAMFLRENRELIAVSRNDVHFNIVRKDITRGSAIRLAGSWSYRK